MGILTAVLESKDNPTVNKGAFGTASVKLVYAIKNKY